MCRYCHIFVKSSMLAYTCKANQIVHLNWFYTMFQCFVDMRCNIALPDCIRHPNLSDVQCKMTPSGMSV